MESINRRYLLDNFTNNKHNSMRLKLKIEDLNLKLEWSNKSSITINMRDLPKINLLNLHKGRINNYLINFNKRFNNKVVNSNLKNKPRH